MFFTHIYMLKNNTKTIKLQINVVNKFIIK